MFFEENLEGTILRRTIMFIMGTYSASYIMHKIYINIRENRYGMGRV